MTARDVQAILFRIYARTRMTAHGCHEWTGALSQSGHRGVFYPVLRVGPQVYRVTRLVLILEHPEGYPPLPGEPLADYLARASGYFAGREAAHTCDHARCVAGAHLEWQTHRGNIAGQVERRRLARGQDTAA